jgi:hypothetical protein
MLPCHLSLSLSLTHTHTFVKRGVKTLKEKEGREGREVHQNRKREIKYKCKKGKKYMQRQTALN